MWKYLCKDKQNPPSTEKIVVHRRLVIVAQYFEKY